MGTMYSVALQLGLADLQERLEDWNRNDGTAVFRVLRLHRPFHCPKLTN